MLGLQWFLRMSRWTRNPPSLRMVLIVLAVLGLCLALAGVEYLWGWPEWLTVNGKPRAKLP
jgi:hypothetical protein